MKKFICLFFVLLISTCSFFVGCSSDNNTSNIKDENDLSAEPVSFEKTMTVIVDNFKTDYKIVIPTGHTKMEEYAATELQYFLEQSTGCVIPIISDEGLSVDDSSKFLSVGKTSLLARQNSIVLDDAYGENTPSVDTIGNSVYMAGVTDYGVLNSVYKFLEYEIGFKGYAFDCYDFRYQSKLYLLDFDYHYRPNISYLSINEYELIGKEQEAARFNEFCGNGGGSTLFDGGLFSGLWCHTATVIVPESSYPWAWNNAQFCMSNPDGIKVFCENFTMNFALNARGPFAMIGGNDNESICNCPECTEIVGKYGSGGLMSIFLNKVADYVENYFKEHDIDKKLCIVGLYYLGYDDIPAVPNGDGTYSPVDKCVIPDNEGNITTGICYAPMLACYAHPFGDNCCEKNVMYTENFKKMSALTENSFVYIYGFNCSSPYYQLYFFNNMSTFSENYKFFKQLGVRYVNEESNRYGISALSSLKTYIRTRFAWDEKTDIDEVIKEFTDVYYGVAADYMRDYLDAIMEHYQSVYIRNPKGYHESIYSSTISTASYPHQVYLNFATILENAMHVIEKSDLAEEEKQIYFERVKREWYIVKVQEYDMNKNSVDKDYLAELERIFEEGQSKYDIWVSRREH